MTAVSSPRTEPAPVPPQTAPPPTRPQPDERRSPDLMTVLTSIGSPLALATALLFYFGWVRSEEQASAFGADASVFAMSTQDYVLRSVNILFFPVILLLLVSLLALRLDRRLRTHGPPPPLGAAPVGRAAVLVGVVPAAGLPARRGRRPSGRRAAPVLGDVGDPRPGLRHDAASRRADGDPRRFSFRATALLMALVTVCLFWQTERLASLGGEVLAQDVKDNLADRLHPVELFSAKDLSITGPGVTATAVGRADAAYRYRYSGLYLLQRSGGKYFLLTAGWDQDEGRLVVLPDDPDNRLEFGP